MPILTDKSLFDIQMGTGQQHLPRRTAPHEARRWLMGGRVQGVGYRAFVFNLAQRFDLGGVVQNLTGEVLVEAQGEPASLDSFAAALLSEAPPLARPHIISCQIIPLRELNGFEILFSAAASRRDIHIPPDYFLCEDCRRELTDPGDRRYRYPFINCTQCGPRYTLITRDALRQAEHHDGGFSAVRGVPGRISKTRTTAASTRSRWPARSAGRS